MRMYDLILKKRNGGTLAEAEIRAMVNDYVAGKIPDYQMSAMLMAIWFIGMDDAETYALTAALAESGDQVDLSAIPGRKADKHSTGGVGDKTSLVALPLAAACGVKIAKMSGRGLGHTGGTVDKLEAIPGFRTTLSREDFFRIVNETGLALIGQSGDLAPGDKKLYALRDVTATVDSIPLIAASIMSKKIAAGSDCILLDVKTGSGAFMKTLDESILLAEKMVAIGERAGRRTAALVTDMDIPLGRKIGNALEVEEAIDTLRGDGPLDLTEVSLSLAAGMLELALDLSPAESRRRVEAALHDGHALASLKAMIAAQGGDSTVVDEPDRLPQARFSAELEAWEDAYIDHMNAEEIGVASSLLGAGRMTLDSKIDPAAGLILLKKTGDYVRKGDAIAEFRTNDRALLSGAMERFRGALRLSTQAPPDEPLIYAKIDRDGVTRYS